MTALSELVHILSESCFSSASLVLNASLFLCSWEVSLPIQHQEQSELSHHSALQSFGNSPKFKPSRC